MGLGRGKSLEGTGDLEELGRVQKPGRVQAPGRGQQPSEGQEHRRVKELERGRDLGGGTIREGTIKRQEHGRGMILGVGGGRGGCWCLGGDAIVGGDMSLRGWYTLKLMCVIH